MRLQNFRLMAPAGDGDGGGGDAEDVVTLDDKDPADDDQGGEEDRGDALEAPLEAKDLKKVAGEADEQQEPAKNKGSQHVPIGRFNEVNEAKKALERELAELKAKPAAAPAPAEPEKKEPPKFDEDAAEKEYADFLVLGEIDKAVALRKQINAHLRAQAKSEAVAETETNREQRETVLSLTQVANKAVQDWPYLDTEDGADTMALIIAARDGFAAKGMPVAKALQKAVDQIAPKYAPEDAPGKASTDAGGKKDTREQQANARGADASNRQPPRLDGGAGNRTQGAKVDVEALDDDQFDALSPAEKRKHRGDDV